MGHMENRVGRKIAQVARRAWEIYGQVAQAAMERRPIGGDEPFLRGARRGSRVVRHDNSPKS